MYTFPITGNVFLIQKIECFQLTQKLNTSQQLCENSTGDSYISLDYLYQAYSF